MAAELFFQFPNPDALGPEFGLGAVGAGQFVFKGGDVLPRAGSCQARRPHSQRMSRFSTALYPWNAPSPTSLNGRRAGIVRPPVFGPPSLAPWCRPVSVSSNRRYSGICSLSRRF